LEKKFKEFEKGDDITPFDGRIRIRIWNISFRIHNTRFKGKTSLKLLTLETPYVPNRVHNGEVPVYLTNALHLLHRVTEFT
jgi:hypothetical protein